VGIAQPGLSAGEPVSVGECAIIALFWDGGLQRIVEKGLLGFLINAALLIALLLFNWPSL
jgi:hypothetical protein